MDPDCRADRGERPHVVPQTFYNPYITSSSGGGKRDVAGRAGRQAGPTRAREKRPKHTYVTDLSEFKFIAPRCLDDDGGGGSSGAGTHVGTLNRRPVTYRDGETVEFLDYEKSVGKLWPVRTKLWGDAWYGSEDFDPRFSRFHVYDMIESTETSFSGEGRDSPRFLQLINPIGTVITLLGMTDCGKRVAVHVYGVCPYFYMLKRDTDAACGSTCPRDLVDRMVSCLRDVASGPASFAKYATRECFDVDVVMKTDIYHYGTPSSEFYRITVRNSRHVSTLCDNFCPTVTKYEGQVDAVTRLILDNDGFVTFGWYRLTNGAGGEKVQVRRPEHHATSCDVEINCTVDNLSCETDASELPGYKLMCFDIECKAGGGNEMAFPVAEREEDVVIQISCLLYSLRERALERIMLFSLGSCDLPRGRAEDGVPPPDVFEFDSEFELLLAFATFVKQYAPEFVTGYNIVNFDWAFLYGKLVDVYGIRLDGYGAANRGGTFRVWDVGANRFQKKSKAKINGVVILDMYSVATEKLRLPSYKLDAVSESVLGEKKNDLPYKEIPGRFASGPEGRGTIGAYCIQDSLLVGKLFFKFLPHLELAAVAKLAGILLCKAIYDGQQVRVFTCILRLASTKGFVLPDNRSRFGGGAHDALEPLAPSADEDVAMVEDDVGEGMGDDDISGDCDPCASAEDAPVDKKQPPAKTSGRTVGYQGATVLDPVSGFHVDPVVVFDFASLYPSIIQAHNLCFTTLALDADKLEGLTPDKDYFEIRVLDKPLYFVRKHVRESLLALLLNDWLAMRKAIRARIATAEDEEQAVLLDKQQAAIKVVCNSVYGFCGVSNGFLPCLDVAATVTTIGRDMLLRVRDHVHAEWGSYQKLVDRFPSIANGQPEARVPEGRGAYSCAVIYGDTDSVFVKFRGVPAEALVAAGSDMARAVSDALFKSPIKLECEKTFTKLLLITKKKYIGTVHGGKMIMKGVELVRRSNCRFINEYSRRLVNLLFGDEGVASAAAEIGAAPADEWITRPLPSGIKPFGDVLVEAYEKVARPAGELDVKDFIMSAELSRPADAYVNRRIAHLTVYYKLKMRAEQEPAVKERISYVIAEPSEELERDADAVSRLRGDFAPWPPAAAVADGEARAPKKRKLLISDMAEDPKYVVEKKARLSTDYYFSHLIGSLAVTFKALFGNDTKITEMILKRFIPETFFEPREDVDRLTRAGFAALEIGAGRDPVTEGEENRRKLRKALRTLTRARRLC